MIPDIKEINFPPYATLSEATVKHEDMGDKTITATIKIDGQIAPDFSYDWIVEYEGERYIHPLRKPQASKDNKDIRSSIDLTFRHWVIHELRRFYFVEMSSIESGTAIPDKFEASLSLHLGDFIDALNNVLRYWYGDRIRASLYEGWQYAIEPSTISISYTKIWDVLQKMYELYGIRWQIIEDPADHEKAIIQFGYPTDVISHTFEYGYAGGLLKTERQVQSDEIHNIILGRGGDKNVPYRYFKKLDPKNPSFPQDPDWVPELANIYFDRIRDAAFRSYVQGWKKAHKDTEAYKDVDGQYLDRSTQSAVPWAYMKGYSDKKFDPVEFAADEITSGYGKLVEIYPNYSDYITEGSSIDKYGPIWGSLENNDDIYPTIQGVTIPPYGRIDQAVDVEVVEDDDVESAVQIESELSVMPTAQATAKDVGCGEYVDIEIPLQFYSPEGGVSNTLVVPFGKVANIVAGVPRVKVTNINGYVHGIIIPLQPDNRTNAEASKYADRYVNTTTNGIVKLYNTDTLLEHSGTGVPPGTYTGKIIVTVQNQLVKNNGEFHAMETSPDVRIKSVDITVSYTNNELTIYDPYDENDESWKGTFNIWVKNIWQTQKGENETPEEYVERVWKPILGDRDNNEAKVVFSTGRLSISQDYEFTIIGPAVTRGIHYDTSRMLDGVPSEWRITCAKSDAELDTTGLYIPNSRLNASAGDFLFFVGIDLPYLYYTEAEKRLTAYKKDQFKDVADIKPKWVVTLDKVRIGRAAEGETEAILNALKVGNKFPLWDDRFLPNTKGEELYIQSVTRTYKSPTNEDPYIVPDVEVVLSDDIVVTTNPVAELQGSVDALSKQLGSISNIEQIVRAIGDRLYLRKDGISDISFSPTQFVSLLTSRDFLQGNLGGAGWGIYRDANGDSIIEVDRAIIRKDISVTELIINQVSARGGMILETGAAIECTAVIETENGYQCFFEQKRGQVHNYFKVDDVAFNERWDDDYSQIKYYKRRVIEVGSNYIVLAKSNDSGDVPNVDGNSVPEAGDAIVHYGNYTDRTRQYVIIRDTIDGGYERFLQGLDSVAAKGEEYWFVGTQGDGTPRAFLGVRKDDQYIEFKDNKLHIPATLIIGAKFNDGLTLEQHITQAEKDLQGYDYLKAALSETTVVKNGLILTSLIQLGRIVGSEYVVYSGINGQPLDSRFGYGIAAWYGGNMIDLEHLAEGESAVNAAKSLFRFDGSGYLANGAITWNEKGEGGLGRDSKGEHIITWTSDPLEVRLSEDIKLGASDKTLETIVSFMNKFDNMFELVPWNGKILIHAKYDGFYSSGEISALGAGSIPVEELHTSRLGDLTNVADAMNNTATDNRILVQYANTDMWTSMAISELKIPHRLSDLSDISISSPQNGQALVYNGGVWVNQFITPTITPSDMNTLLPSTAVIKDIEERLRNLENK